MCLAVPGRVVSISEHGDSLERTGKVDFAGIGKTVSLAYVPEAKVDDYVIVHVGFALQVVDPEEAHQIFDYLKQMGDLAELEVV
jgi:hydrogenase expression/formation protein HypC